MHPFCLGHIGIGHTIQYSYVATYCRGDKTKMRAFRVISNANLCYLTMFITPHGLYLAAVNVELGALKHYNNAIKLRYPCSS